MTSGLTDGQAIDPDGGSVGGAPPDAGDGGAGSSSGGGASGAGAPGGAAGGAADPSARCAEIAAEYATSFAEQLTCNPGGADQCQDRIEAAAGCGCLVFIEPKDPFAIEHLTNVFIDYLDADCENPGCLSTCAGGARGTCGADGRCTSEP